MKRASLWLLVAALTVGVGGPVWAQAQPAVTLAVLNPVTPGTNVAVVVQGDPVQVQYAVSAFVDSSPSDLIQLRRLDNGTVVSEQTRGDLTGTVSLDTTPSAALGDLEVIYVLSATGSVLATAPQTVRVVSSGQSGPTNVVVPSAAAPTIQAGINLVADGGTVQIGPGTFREKLLIVGKRVNLVGSGFWGFRRTLIAGSLPRTVVPYQQAQGLITFGPGGGGSISNLILQGGDAGVVGTEDERGSPAAVEINDAVIRMTGRGVLGSFSRLAVQRVGIIGTLRNGMSIVKAADLEISFGYVAAAQGYGILVFNDYESPQPIVIHDELVELNALGGIVVAGDARSVYITNCQCYYNWVAGIELVDTGTVWVTDTIVYRVFLGATYRNGLMYDNQAWGLLAWDSDSVIVISSSFTGSEKGGIIYECSGGAILDTFSASGNRFGLVLQGEPKPYYADPANTFTGTEQDILTDGALPVPQAPPLPNEDA